MSHLFKRLGYPTKNAYFSSPEFKDIRAEYLEANPTCKNCGKEAQTIYFLEHTLANLKGESYEGTIPLCYECQAKCSTTTNKADKWVKNFNKSGKKRRW